MQLSLVERQILYNQCMIMSVLVPDEKDYWELRMKVLDSGYTSWYDEIVAVDPDELSEQECSFVNDVLSMFRHLHSSFDELSDKTGIKESSVSFQGFDGNDETKLFSFASFLLKDAKRWNEFSKVDCNSHARRVSRYTRMLEVYNSLSLNSEPLTREQILLIIES